MMKRGKFPIVVLLMVCGTCLVTSESTTSSPTASSEVTASTTSTIGTGDVSTVTTYLSTESTLSSSSNTVPTSTQSLETSTSSGETHTSSTSTASNHSSTLSDYSSTSLTVISETAASSSGSTSVSSSASSTGHSQSSGSSSTSEKETSTSASSTASIPSSSFTTSATVTSGTTGSSSGSTSVSSPASSTGHSQSSGSSSTSENETTTSASSTANSPSSTLSDYSTTSVTGTSENAASSSGSTAVSSSASSTGHSQSSGSSSTSENETTTSAYSSVSSPSSTTSDYSKTSVTVTTENTTPSSGSTSVSSLASSTEDTSVSASESTTISTYNSPSSSYSPLLTTTEAEQTTLYTNETDENTTSTTISPTTSHSTTTPSYVVDYPVDSLVLVVDLEVTLGDELPFNESLQNRSTNYFRQLARDFESEMNRLFANETKNGFKEVSVTRFRNGSIIVDFEMKFYGGTELENVGNETFNRLDGTKKIILINKNVTVDANRTIITQAFDDVTDAEPCDKYEGIAECRPGYSCNPRGNSSIICTPVCYLTNHLKECQNGGVCYYDEPRNATMCRCPETDEHIYSGDLCQDKTDKLALSLPYIIGITAGVGGALLLFAIVLLVILCCRRSNQEGKGHLSDFGPGPDYNDVPTEARRSLSEGPSSSSAFFHGREHRVVTDSIGNPTYLYQPDGKRKHSIEDSHVNYGYQDNESDVMSGAYTEIKPGSSLSNLNLPEKFEIERPKLKPAANNPYYF
ncbi:serine-rich adhesin for platelets-like [Mya arenaria]|uniref:serine-rich adhesin for platelets-like n=1 Tax=Mya arenaria TaxID=6604 RepID=UPI0022DF3E31|nr:serine-rich adhesin for platelets-like [Mya arenaria]